MYYCKTFVFNSIPKSKIDLVFHLPSKCTLFHSFGILWKMIEFFMSLRVDEMRWDEKYRNMINKQTNIIYWKDPGCICLMIDHYVYFLKEMSI